jgi:hypothetical protein
MVIIPTLVVAQPVAMRYRAKRSFHHVKKPWTGVHG